MHVLYVYRQIMENMYVFVDFNGYTLLGVIRSLLGFVFKMVRKELAFPGLQLIYFL